MFTLPKRQVNGQSFLYQSCSAEPHHNPYLDSNGSVRYVHEAKQDKKIEAQQRELDSLKKSTVLTCEPLTLKPPVTSDSTKM